MLENLKTFFLWCWNYKKLMNLYMVQNEKFAAYLKHTTGKNIDPESSFDVMLREYEIRLNNVIND